MLNRSDAPRTNLLSLGMAVVLFILLDVSVLAMNLWISWQVEKDAIAINLAGRQRMLSQRMTKAALLLAQNSETEKAKDAFDELQLSARLFDQTLNAFARGGSATGGDNRPLEMTALGDAEASTLVAVAGERWQPLHGAISGLSWPGTRSASDAVAKALVAGNRGLLDLMNRLTSRMEAASLAQTERLRVVQSIAFFLALVNFAVILRMLTHRFRQANARSQQLHEMVNQLGAGVLLLDTKGTIISANRVAQSLFGRGESFLPGQQLEQLLRQEGEHAFGYRDSGELWVAEVTLGSVVQDGVTLTIATVLDITARYQQAQSLAYQANHDPLTGLPNRRLFDDRYEQALMHATRSQGMLGVAVIDLDEFKPINDQYGHAVGDLVLKAFAERLLGCMRASDTVARVGGDEFVCLLLDVRGEADLVTFAHRVCRALGAPVQAGGHELHLQASMGLALYPGHAQDTRGLLAAADAAMYRAKSSGHAFLLAQVVEPLCLQVFPGQDDSPLNSVSVALTVAASGDLQLDYRFEGNIEQLALPPQTKPGMADGLWQHTCCELFVATKGNTSYREFNFSPSGQWAIYDFGDYRQRLAAPLPDAVPRIELTPASATDLRIRVRVPAILLPPPGENLELGLTVVTEARNGSLAYWALAHPGDKPDFHHRQSFKYTLVR